MSHQNDLNINVYLRVGTGLLFDNSKKKHLLTELYFFLRLQIKSSHVCLLMIIHVTLLIKLRIYFNKKGSNY